MAMPMRMLMTLANGDGAAQGKLWKLWKLHATACCHQCLLAEYYYDGACCFTANGRLILSFVQSQWGSATHWEWKTKEGVQGRQLTWPASQEIVLTVARAASASASASDAATAAVPPARSIFAFCVLSAVLYFSSSILILYPPCPPFFVYFKFLFPLHFLCVSFARFSLTGGLTMKEESCTVLTLYYPRQKKLTTCHSLPSLPTVLHSLGIEQLAT